MAGHSNTWRDSKVDTLLDVWSNNAIQQQLSGSYRNGPVYHKIEAELAKRGVLHKWKQCRDKLKALKKKYKEVVDRLRRNGVGLGWTTIQ